MDECTPLVAGITPTPLGEGKTTTTIGLCQALGKAVQLQPVFTPGSPLTALGFSAGSYNMMPKRFQSLLSI